MEEHPSSPGWDRCILFGWFATFNWPGESREIVPSYCSRLAWKQSLWKVLFFSFSFFFCFWCRGCHCTNDHFWLHAKEPIFLPRPRWGEVYKLVTRVSIRNGSGNHSNIISVHLMDMYVYVCVEIMASLMFLWAVLKAIEATCARRGNQFRRSCLLNFSFSDWLPQRRCGCDCRIRAWRLCAGWKDLVWVLQQRCSCLGSLPIAVW